MDFLNLNDEQKALVAKAMQLCGSNDARKSQAGTQMIAKALELPLRKGIMSGDIVLNSGIFQRIPISERSTAEFPLHWLRPGTENEYVAYTIPNHGKIPQRRIEGDYVMVPTYSTGASIDWSLHFARDARYDIIGGAMENMRDQFTKKINDDGFHVVIASGVDRNLVVVDTDATAGFLSKRLVSLAKTTMRRNGGGNSTSQNRGELTDLFLSPEGIEDMRNWNVDEVDEVTRREIYVTSDEGLNKIYGVRLHDLDELGEGQEYQLYYTNELAGTLPASKLEIAIGLDLSKRDSFVMPIRSEIEIFDDPTLHRHQLAGLYGWGEWGFAALDGRRSMILAF